MDVTCAVIIGNGRLLAVRHGVGSRHRGKWEFPGGKVNDGESAHDCIVREIGEELNVQIDVVAELSAVEYIDGRRPIRLIPFVCSMRGDEFTLTEHDTFQWIVLSQCQDLDWLPADRELLRINYSRIADFIGEI